MAYEQKDMSGSLFRNNRKEKETHPDYSGTVRIDGHDMWISAWLREQKDGTKYFSLAFKRKDGTAIPVEVATRPAKVGDDDVLLSVIREVTERRELHDTITELRRRLETTAMEARR